MALNGEYDYRAQVEILIGGYDGEAKGVTPEDNSWHTTSNETGSATYTYYYTDSNTPDAWPGDQKNAQSSQVQINATDTWSVRIDEDNNVIVTVNTVVNWVRRAEIRGNPNYIGTWGRDIQLSRQKGATPFWTVSGDPINYAHDLAGRINVATETFTLKPGQSNARGSIYVLNHTAGLAWEPIYMDEMWAGISFRNNLPADYRPGAVFNGLEWRCSNNPNGACSVYDGSKWVECRTENGGTGTGNPPLAYNGSAWVNQLKIPNQKA